MAQKKRASGSSKPPAKPAGAFLTPAKRKKTFPAQPPGAFDTAPPGLLGSAPIFQRGPAHDKAQLQASHDREAVKAIKKHNKAVVKEQQATPAQGRIIANRVSAQAGLTPPGSPFGVGGRGARDPYVADLTAKVGLAKANQQRRQQGGLLTPEQAAREHAASRVVGNSKALSFRQTHDLSRDPTFGDLTRLQPTGRRPAPGEPAQTAPPPSGGGGGGLLGALGDVAGDVVDRARQPLLPEPLRNAASVGLGTALGAVNALPSQLNLGAIQQRGTGLGTTNKDLLNVKPQTLPHALHETEAGVAKVSEKAAARLASLGAPDVSGVRVPNIDFGVGVAQASTGSTPLGEIPFSAGLTPEATKKWRTAALANGWNQADIDGLVGVELIKRGIQKPPPWYERYPLAFASGVVRTGAAPLAIHALVTDALTGHSMRAAQQLGEALISEAPLIGKHRWTDSLQADPFGTLTTLIPELKAAGMAGHLTNRGEAIMRVVDLHGMKPGVEGSTVVRGPYSKNYYDQIGQRISDTFARRTPVGSRRVQAGIVDRANREGENATAPDFVRHQVEYAKAVDTVSRRRAVLLRAYHAAGGDPESMVELYKNEAMKLGKAKDSAAAGQAKFWQTVVDLKKSGLSHEDQAFIEAHKNLSAHTSETMAAESGFGPNSIKYRRYELQLIAKEQKGDPLAKEILQMREELYGKASDGSAADMTGVKAQIRALTTQRNSLQRRIDSAKKITDRPPPEAPPEIAAHSEALKAHAVKDAEWKKQLAAIDEAKPQPTKLRSNASAKSREAAATKDKAALSDWRKTRKEHVATREKKPATPLTFKSDKQRQKYETDKAAIEEKYTPPKGASPDAKALLRDQRQTAMAKLTRKYSTSTAHVGEKKVAKGAGKRAGARKSTNQTTLAGIDKRIADLNMRVLHSEIQSDPGYEGLQHMLGEKLDEFAATHMQGEGNIEPARVAYSQPGAIVARKRQAVSQIRFGHVPKRAYASTGARAQSGDYLINEHSPIIESMQAQRFATSTARGRELLDNGIRVKPFDEIPKGYVFVSDKSASTLRRTVNKFVDNPVDEADHYAAESGFRSNMVDEWKRATELPRHQRERVPSGQNGVLIPKGQYDRVLQYMQPVNRTKYLQFLAFYQRQLISLYPSTLLGNTLGTLPMALMAGVGPESLRMAGRSIRDKEIVPHTASRHGVAGSMRRSAAGRNPYVQYTQTMRDLTTLGEDFSKHAVYWRTVLKDMKKHHKEFNLKQADDAQVTFDEYARMAARGEVSRDLVDRGLRKANEMLGDNTLPDGRVGHAAAHVLLFHKWLGHVVKLMLWTMPLKHPGALLLMNTLAKYADQWRKAHGVWPDWMKDFAAVGDHIVGGRVFTRAVGLGQLAPQNTAGNFLETLTQQNLSFPERLLGLTSPVAQTIGLAGKQAYDNQTSNYPAKSVPWTIAHGIAYGIPGMAKFSPSTSGQSVPLIHPDRRVFTTGESKSAYRDPRIPWADRPGPRPVGSDAPILSAENFYGVLSRILGFPIYDMPKEGDINTAQNEAVERKTKRKAGISSGYGGYGK